MMRALASKPARQLQHSSSLQVVYDTPLPLGVPLHGQAVLPDLGWVATWESQEVQAGRASRRVCWALRTSPYATWLSRSRPTRTRKSGPAWEGRQSPVSSQHWWRLQSDLPTPAGPSPCLRALGRSCVQGHVRQLYAGLHLAVGAALVHFIPADGHALVQLHLRVQRRVGPQLHSLLEVNGALGDAAGVVVSGADADPGVQQADVALVLHLQPHARLLLRWRPASRESGNKAHPGVRACYAPPCRPPG